MMHKRTMTCPNGCDPDSLIRESWLREPGGYLPEDQHTHYGVRYICEACGWEADWNDVQGLMVNDPGALGPMPTCMGED